MLLPLKLVLEHDCRLLYPMGMAMSGNLGMREICIRRVEELEVNIALLCNGLAATTVVGKL